MKAVLQRVSSAKVEVEGKIVSQINKGFVILLGVQKNDTEMQADILCNKTAKLRIFEDDNQKLNLSVKDTLSEILVVSNFTVCADCKKGCRPSFSNAADFEKAKILYEYYCKKLKEYGISTVKKGEFGENMEVSLVNDGPVTIILDTNEL